MSNKKIKLMPEKQRIVIGQIPHSVTINCTIIIAFIVILLMTSLILVPSPDSTGDSFGSFLIHKLNPLNSL